MKKKISALIATGLAMASMSATAVPVRIDYSFSLISGFGGFPNADVTGVAIYDTDAPPISDFSIARAVLSHDVTINGITYSQISSAQNQISFDDNVPTAPPRDRISLTGAFDFFLSPTLHVSFVGIVFEGPSTNFVESTPHEIDPSLYPPSLRQFGFAFQNGSQCPSCFIHGANPTATFTPVTSVPEPSTLALVGLGLAGLGLMRRRKPA